MFDIDAQTLAGIRAQVQAVPLRTVGEIDEGPVALEGHAAPLELTSSPITGVPVIGYRVRVEVWPPEGRPRTVDVARANDFELVDGSGRALVRVAWARLLLLRECRYESGQMGSVSGTVLRFLRRQLRDDERWLRTAIERFRWTEYYLEPGEPTYVCGFCRFVVDPSENPVHYRTNVRKPTICRPADGDLVVADQHSATLLPALTPWVARLRS